MNWFGYLQTHQYKRYEVGSDLLGKPGLPKGMSGWQNGGVTERRQLGYRQPASGTNMINPTSTVL